MPRLCRSSSAVAALLASLLASALLVSCGGGGGGGDGSSTSGASQSALAQEPNAPQFSGNTATDGYNWFNYRRRQTGLSAVAQNGAINAAAQGHSDYQKLNDTITHTQTAGKPGFTGVNLSNRLNAAGYTFNQGSYAYGEVISASGDPSGFNAAEDLITAIYHRFVILEPMFLEVGTGSATVPNGYTYFTADFAANGLGPGLGQGNVVTYPAPNQQNIPIIFYSDRESPDPVPNQNETGYPVSVHADITSVVTVQSFTLQPRNGTPLAVRLLSHANDANTPNGVAAIVPLAVLAPRTTYDAQFIGTVGGAPVNRSWSFTTR